MSSKKNSILSNSFWFPKEILIIKSKVWSLRISVVQVLPLQTPYPKAINPNLRTLKTLITWAGTKLSAAHFSEDWALTETTVSVTTPALSATNMALLIVQDSEAMCLAALHPEAQPVTWRATSYWRGTQGLPGLHACLPQALTSARQWSERALCVICFCAHSHSWPSSLEPELGSPVLFFPREPHVQLVISK